MELLNYEVLKKSGYEGYILESAPEKVMQFGEGNFLRAFVDYWFDVANEKAGWNGKCVLVQPIRQGLTDMINAQEGLYTLYLRGRENGENVLFASGTIGGERIRFTVYIRENGYHYAFSDGSSSDQGRYDDDDEDDDDED